MSVTLDDKQAAIIDSAYYLWFTTTRDDGQAQPTPVWFIHDNGTFLIFSQPNAQKVKNIRLNPKVALSYTNDPHADTYLVVMGEAQIVEGGVPITQTPAYLAKYRTGIEALGMTPESMAATYSTLIRVTPTRIRGE